MSQFKRGGSLFINQAFTPFLCFCTSRSYAKGRFLCLNSLEVLEKRQELHEASLIRSDPRVSKQLIREHMLGGFRTSQVEGLGFRV